MAHQITFQMSMPRQPVDIGELLEACDGVVEIVVERKRAFDVAVANLSGWAKSEYIRALQVKLANCEAFFEVMGIEVTMETTRRRD